MRKLVSIQENSFKKTGFTIPEKYKVEISKISKQIDVLYKETDSKGAKYSIFIEGVKSGFLIVSENQKQLILKEIYLDTASYRRTFVSNLDSTSKGLGEAIVRELLESARMANKEEFIIEDTSNYGLIKMVASKISPLAQYVVTNKLDEHRAEYYFDECNWLRDFGMVMIKVAEPVQVYGVFSVDLAGNFSHEDDTFYEMGMYPYLEKQRIRIRRLDPTEDQKEYKGVQVTLPGIRVDIRIPLHELN